MKKAGSLLPAFLMDFSYQSELEVIWFQIA